jgi:hypothetical protein
MTRGPKPKPRPRGELLAAVRRLWLHTTTPGPVILRILASRGYSLNRENLRHDFGPRQAGGRKP